MLDYREKIGIEAMEKKKEEIKIRYPEENLQESIKKLQEALNSPEGENEEIKQKVKEYCRLLLSDSKN